MLHLVQRNSGATPIWYRARLISGLPGDQLLLPPRRYQPYVGQ
jgi:hypothetical protein